MQDMMYGFTNMIFDAKKKEWEGKDALRLYDGDEDLFKDPPLIGKNVPFASFQCR